MNPPSKLHCICGTTNWFRIPRPLWVKIMFFWLPLKWYKCYMCDRKKWVLGR